MKADGFVRFTARTAWRFEPALHVVNFQSFNSYTADLLGCTTFSFAVNLGLHFGFMPWGVSTEYVGPERPPNEAQCILRKPLRRHLPQPDNSDPRFWSVHPTGANVDLCIADALKVVEHEGLPWFAELSVPLNALRIIETEEEQFDKFGPSGTWGFGRPGSPMRNHAIGYLRKALATTR